MQIEVAAATRPGAIDLPGELRYQACDDKLCYPAVTTPVRWTLTVAAPNSPLTRNQPEVFDRIAFGTGTAPAAAITAPVAKPGVNSGDDGLAQLREFTVWRAPAVTIG